MKDYLMRQDAPLSEEQWSNLDDMVIKVAKGKLVGRKIVNTYGPIGGGVQSIELDTIDLNGEANYDKLANNETEKVEISKRRFIPIPLIHKDFMITWRDIESAKQLNRTFDNSLVAAATSSLARKEDEIIFNGSEDSEGLMNASGRLTIEKGNWNEGDNPYKDVAGAIGKLINSDSYDPYALVVSPDLFIQLQRIQEGTGVTILSRVKELVDGRIYQSPVLDSGKGVVVSMGPQNADLVLGEDMITAYMGDENLNHLFRVMESIALRVKRPQSICTIE